MNFIKVLKSIEPQEAVNIFLDINVRTGDIDEIRQIFWQSSIGEGRTETLDFSYFNFSKIIYKYSNLVFISNNKFVTH